VLGRREDGRDRHRVQALRAQITNSLYSQRTCK
jgi:hypothetical protein